MVRVMRFFTLLGGVIILGLLLVACDTSPEAGSQELTEPTDDCPIPVEEDALIVFSGWGDPTEQAVYRESIERFMARCPSVTVDYQPVPADYQTKIMTTMVGGVAADAFYVDVQLMASLAPTGQLLPLDDFMAEAGVSRDLYMDTLMPMFTLDDQTFALPKDWGTLGLVYLPEAFAAAGIDEPTPDWGWEELHAAAKAIAATGEYGGFCQNADSTRFAPFLFGNGGSYTNEDFTDSLLDSAEVTEAGQFIADMKADGSLTDSSLLGASWCGEAIGKQLVGMTYEGGWMVNSMKNDYPDVVWKAQELPGGPVGKGDIIFTNGIGVNANSKYPRAAAALMMYITGEENQGAIVQSGFAYSTHVSQADLVVDPNDLAISKGGQMPLSLADYWGPNTGKVNAAVSQAMERIYLGAQTVEASFAQADKEVQGFLDEANEE